MATVMIGGRSYQVEIHGDTVVVDGHEFPVSIRRDKGYLTVTAGQVPYRVQLPPEGERESGMTVDVDYHPLTVTYDGRFGGGAAVRHTRAAAAAANPGATTTSVQGGVNAQIAGRVLAVKVKPGDAVERGDVLLILEAMKMENEIKAPAAGTVKDVLVVEGARVAEGQTLVVLD